HPHSESSALCVVGCASSYVGRAVDVGARLILLRCGNGPETPGLPTTPFSPGIATHYGIRKYVAEYFEFLDASSVLGVPNWVHGSSPPARPGGLTSGEAVPAPPHAHLSGHDEPHKTLQTRLRSVNIAARS